MVFIFITHCLPNNVYRPHVLRLAGHVVYSGPKLLKLEAAGIVEADRLFESRTGIDPCKPPKGSGIMVGRFCPELDCNRNAAASPIF